MGFLWSGMSEDLIRSVYIFGMGEVYVSLLEFLSFFLLILNLVFLTYVLRGYGSPGLYSIWFFVVLMVFLKVVHFYVIFTDTWTDLIYKVSYGLSAFLPVIVMYAFLFLYGGFKSLYVKLSSLYFGGVGLYFVYSVSTSSVKTYLLTSPHVGGEAIEGIPRMIHPLLSIPAFIIMVFITVRYIWLYGVYGDTILLFLSILIYSLGGIFLRLGAFEIFHLLDMVGSISLILASYYVLKALSEGRLYKRGGD